MIILKNGTLLNSSFRFISSSLSIDGESIAEISNDIEPSVLDDVIDCTDLYVLPGYIDIHTHGCAGFDNMDSGFDAMSAISEHMAKHGTLTYLPTIMTASHETLTACAKNIADFAKSGKSIANIGGIYSEGPYFSEERRGAQNPLFLKNPSLEEFEELYRASGGLLRIMSLAPERDGAQDFIKSVSHKVRIALGHTDADYDTAVAAIENGASVMTHTFNAMKPLLHRSPNAIGAALDSNIFLECICDGFHIHPAVIRILFALAKERLVLISDSLRATGLKDGIYESGGQEVIMKDGRLFLNDGSNTIAGSSSHLADCVKHAVNFGISVEDAVRAASYNPARAAGIDNITGSLRENLRADILITDKQLNIKYAVIRGKVLNYV